MARIFTAFSGEIQRESAVTPGVAGAGFAVVVQGTDGKVLGAAAIRPSLST
jgi:hypothetical protein